MKFLTLFFVLLNFGSLKSFAQACPELTGDFICKSDGSNDEIFLRQSIRNNKPYYYDETAPESGWLVENKEVTLPDEAPRKNIRITVSCDTEKLKMKVLSELYYGSEIFAYIQEYYSMELTSGGDLKLSDKTILSMPEEEDEVEEDIRVCERER